MNERLGLNIHRDAWPTAPLLAAHEAAGFAWVQVHTPPWPVLAERGIALAHARALRAELSATGLRLLLHAPDDLSAGTPETDLAFEGLLEYSAQAGAELIAYHGLNFADADDGPAAERVRERALLEELSLTRLLQRAHSLGVTVAIENLAPMYAPPVQPPRRCHDPLAVRNLVRRLDSPAVGMLLDLGHLHITSDARRGDHSAVLAACAPDVVLFHVHDNLGARRRGIGAPTVDPLKLDLHLPPGRGTLPWSRLAPVLAEHSAPLMLGSSPPSASGASASPTGRPACSRAGSPSRRSGLPRAAPHAGASRRVREDGAVTTVPLTSLSHGAGCGCKLPAAALLPIVRDLPHSDDPRLLVGSSTSDDAAVFRLSHDLALVQTIDFFTPIVDDPYDFGRIAAANALSDVYAMGGRPLTAMNIVAFPLERLGGDVLREVLRGGLDVVTAAGAALVGGHSIDDPEPKYGLAVTGTVDPRALVTNAGGRAGDALVLTKPLGVGAIVTARKRGEADDTLLSAAVAIMAALNDAAAEAAVAAGARAMTDVTGFGLLGHLRNMARESGLAAEVKADAVPAIPGVEALLHSEDGVSGGSRRNAEYADAFTTFAPGVAAWRRRLVTDATTSGGLLVAVPPEAAAALPGVVVGRMHDGEPGTLHVR